MTGGTGYSPIGLTFMNLSTYYSNPPDYGWTGKCSLVGINADDGQSRLVQDNCTNCQSIDCIFGTGGGCTTSSESSVCKMGKNPLTLSPIFGDMIGAQAEDKGCPDITQCSLDGLSDCDPLQQKFVSSASWKVPPVLQPGATTAGVDRAQGTIYCTYAVWDPTDVIKIDNTNPSKAAGTPTFDRLKSLFVKAVIYAACTSLTGTLYSVGAQTPPMCRDMLTIFDDQFNPDTFYECCINSAKILLCQGILQYYFKTSPQFDLSSIAKSCFALPAFHYDAVEGHVVYLPIYTKTVLDSAGLDPTKTLDYVWSDATYYTQEVFQTALWAFLGDKDPKDPSKTAKQAQVTLDPTLTKNTMFLTFEGAAPKAHNTVMTNIISGNGEPDPSGDWSTQFVLGRVYKGVVKKWSLTLLALFASAKSLNLPCDDPAWADLSALSSDCFAKKCGSDGDATCKSDLKNYCRTDVQSSISLDPDGAMDVLSGFLVTQDSPQCDCEGAYMVPTEEQGNEAMEHAARCFDLTCRGYESYYGLSDADCRGNCDLVRSFFWDRPAGERPRLARPDQAKFERLCGPLNPLPFNFAAFGVACGLLVLVYLLVAWVFSRQVGWKLSLLLFAVFFGLALFAGFDLAGTARCADPPNQKSDECRSKITNLKIPMWFCRLLVPCSCQSDADCKETETCTSQVCVPKPDACLVPKPQGEPCKAFPNYRGFCDKDLDFFKPPQGTSGCDEDPSLARFVKLTDKTCYQNPTPTPAAMDKDGPFCYYPGNPFPQETWPSDFMPKTAAKSDILAWGETRYTGDCSSEHSRTWNDGSPCTPGEMSVLSRHAESQGCIQTSTMMAQEATWTQDWRRACLETPLPHPWPSTFPLSGDDEQKVLEWARVNYTGGCSLDGSKTWYPESASTSTFCATGSLALETKSGVACASPDEWKQSSVSLEAGIVGGEYERACLGDSWPTDQFPIQDSETEQDFLKWAYAHYTGDCSSPASQAWYSTKQAPASEDCKKGEKGLVALQATDQQLDCVGKSWNSDDQGDFVNGVYSDACLS